MKRCPMRRGLHLVVDSGSRATTPYGVSKRAAEDALKAYGPQPERPCIIYRAAQRLRQMVRPNYNSVVATFCYNIARGLPIDVHDRHAPLELVYVDDVVEAMSLCLTSPTDAGAFTRCRPVYETTVGEVADTHRTLSRQSIESA